jgi:hypothetical protein
VRLGELADEVVEDLASINLGLEHAKGCEIETLKQR